MSLEIYDVGTLVEKCETGPGDRHVDGDLAYVVEVVGPYEGKWGYFVSWCDMPGIPVFLAGRRVRRSAVQPRKTAAG